MAWQSDMKARETPPGCDSLTQRLAAPVWAARRVERGPDNFSTGQAHQQDLWKVCRVGKILN